MCHLIDCCSFYSFGCAVFWVYNPQPCCAHNNSLPDPKLLPRCCRKSGRPWRTASSELLWGTCQSPSSSKRVCIQECVKCFWGFRFIVQNHKFHIVVTDLRTSLLLAGCMLELRLKQLHNPMGVHHVSAYPTSSFGVLVSVPSGTECVSLWWWSELGGLFSQLVMGLCCLFLYDPP